MEVLRCDHCRNDIDETDDHWEVEYQTYYRRFDTREGKRHLHAGCLSPWSLKQEIAIEEGR